VSEIGIRGLGTGDGYKPSAVGKSEMVGYYGSGIKAVPRPRIVRRAASDARRHAMIGLLVAFLSAITVLSAAALMPHAANVPAQTAGTLPPVADFTNTTYPASNLTVMVDATSSTDPDGTIVSYGWDFGDGGAASGVVAYHTYATWGQWWITLTVTDDDAMTGTATVQVNISKPTSPPPPPTNVFGYVWDSDGNPIMGASVTVTDTNTGAVWYLIADIDPGFYMLDLNSNETGWAVGDTIVVEANYGGATGTNSSVLSDVYLELDITLGPAIPEFPMVVLPVLGVIAIAAVASLSRRRTEL